MKTSFVLKKINILSNFIFQISVLDVKFFRLNNRKKFDMEQSQSQRFSNDSVFKKSDETTEKVNPKNKIGEDQFGKLNYTNNSGISKYIS